VMKTNIVTILAATALAAALLSCAGQGAPGGGPEDKEPPVLSASAPVAGQTNIDPRTRVTFTFSEWITTAGASGAVAVYPPLQGGFSVKAAKNRITVIPKEPLKDSTTYHFVVGTSLKDLRNNSIPAPVNVVFSTGAELDSGRFEGAVVPLGPLVTIPRVALYPDYGDGWKDSLYFTPPRYAAYTDSAGAYSFSNLKEGRYRVVAFTDQFRIGRMRVGDPAFTSLERAITVTKAKQTVRLYPADTDTAAVKRVIDGARPDTVPPKLKSHFPLAQSSHLPEIRLVWTKPVRVNLSMVMAVEVRETEKKRGAARGKAGKGEDAAVDTAEARAAAVDTVDIDSVTADSTGINTAETVSADSVAFFVAGSGGYSDTAYLAPSRRLLPSKTYRFEIPVQAVKDSSGISAADSIAFTVKTVHADSICYRLQGGADCLEPSGKRKWVYRPLVTARGGEKETFTVSDKSGTFTFDSIPASKGTLMWFIDDNGDNRLTTGKLSPWRAPERFFAAPDTVEAKARWEIEGLQIRACE